MKTIIYAGHLSRLGRALIKEVQNQEYFEIQKVVLADLGRWISFRKKLLRTESLPNLTGFKKEYYSNLKAIKQLLSPAVELEIIADANKPTAVHLSGCELVLSAAFPQIFSKSFIETPSKAAVNFHPSYLPRCRGANPVYWTIAQQEPFGGLTAHFLTPEIDAGPIIAQKRIEFDPSSITYNALYDKVIESLPAVLDETAGFFQEKREAVVQNDTKGSYFRNDIKIDHKINWNKECSAVIMAKIRAGWGYSFNRTGREVILMPSPTFQAHLPTYAGQNPANLPPGCVVHFNEQKVWIKTLDGFIETPYKFPKHLSDIYGYLLDAVGGRRWRKKMTLLSGNQLKIGEILR